MKTTGAKPNLLPIFTLIEDLAVRLPKDSPPQLLHFLQHRSYTAARLWLEGRNQEIEGCAFAGSDGVVASRPVLGRPSWAFWRRDAGGASAAR